MSHSFGPYCSGGVRCSYRWPARWSPSYSLVHEPSVNERYAGLEEVVVVTPTEDASVRTAVLVLLARIDVPARG